MTDETSDCHEEATKRAETEARDRWEDLPLDPDPNENLGYELAEWERVEASRSSNQVVFLPVDTEMLRDDAFIVSEETALCDLSKKQ